MKHVLSPFEGTLAFHQTMTVHRSHAVFAYLETDLTTLQYSTIMYTHLDLIKTSLNHPLHNACIMTIE